MYNYILIIMYCSMATFSDPDILKEIETWAEPIKSLFDVKIGQTYVKLDGDASVCRKSECNLGNITVLLLMYTSMCLHWFLPSLNYRWHYIT